jgi:hypothetical protein
MKVRLAIEYLAICNTDLGFFGTQFADSRHNAFPSLFKLDVVVWMLVPFDFMVR